MSFAHLSANEAQLPVKPIGFDRGCFLTDKSREVCARVQLFKGIIPEGENYATIFVKAEVHVVCVGVSYITKGQVLSSVMENNYSAVRLVLRKAIDIQRCF